MQGEKDLVFVGLGSNLGDRRHNIRQALLLLDRPEAHVVQVSSLYETEPVGPRPQPDYLNAVCRLETQRSPDLVMAACLDVETQMGRVRDERWGPRIIDLDLLFHGDLIVQSPELILPHPRILERRFVLEPLCELAPDFLDPVSGKTVRELLEECPDSTRVVRIRS